jgi:hypothetical protein
MPHDGVGIAGCGYGGEGLPSPGAVVAWQVPVGLPVRRDRRVMHRGLLGLASAPIRCSAERPALRWPPCRHPWLHELAAGGPSCLPHKTHGHTQGADRLAMEVHMSTTHHDPDSTFEQTGPHLPHGEAAGILEGSAVGRKARSAPQQPGITRAARRCRARRHHGTFHRPGQRESCGRARP